MRNTGRGSMTCINLSASYIDAFDDIQRKNDEYLTLIEV